MSFWVYILRCADGSYYTGHTDNLEKRIGEHTTGAIASCYTFKRRPLELVFSQDFPTREEALTSEQQIKGWSRKKKEAMMRGDWAEVSRLAKSSNTVRAELVEARPAPVRPETFDAVRPESGACRTVDGEEPTPHVRPGPVDRRAHHNRETTTVRPEPVEGQEPSVHPSTSSGRTEGEPL